MQRSGWPIADYTPTGFTGPRSGRHFDDEGQPPVAAVAGGDAAADSTPGSALTFSSSRDRKMARRPAPASFDPDTETTIEMNVVRIDPGSTAGARVRCES